MEYKFKFVEVSDFEFKMSRLQDRPVKAVELIEQIIAHNKRYCRVDMAGVILGVHKATEQPPDGTICTVTWGGEVATIADVQWHLERIHKTHVITGLEKTDVRAMGEVLTCVLAEKREMHSQSGVLVGVMTYARPIDRNEQHLQIAAKGRVAACDSILGHMLPVIKEASKKEGLTEGELKLLKFLEDEVISAVEVARGEKG